MEIRICDICKKELKDKYIVLKIKSPSFSGFFNDKIEVCLDHVVDMKKRESFIIKNQQRKR